ncbi:DUF2931 family protein [Sphingobacterium sp. ML3W]|uniref:DUF2931 family protein n=1 Tax=Sphingobacterium sp. ML3W TaxID=1538644 RepID=UPI00068EA7B7|nr:DUF2931 family protein [Sphingobacterium sp. ML3W]
MSQNTTGATKEFKWRETITCPLGYPVDVYEGGLESNKGSTSLYLGTHTGTYGWGHIGGSMSSGIKPLPNRLDVVWLSYAEDTFYHIDTKLDYDKILALFEEGYLDSFTHKKMTYSTIVVGFAPGGVVVVWLFGAGKQIEVSRYEGKKIVIPEQEIAKLDSHEKLLFNPDYRKSIMFNEKIVPLEVREANKNKPIPFGLWDTYRKKYNWKPSYSIPNGGEAINSFFIMLNGEQEEFIYETFKNRTFSPRAVPRMVNLGWRDSTGQRYGGSVIFNEQEILKVYQELYKNGAVKSAELVFKVNVSNTAIMVFLNSEGQEVIIRENKIEIFKSSKQ